MSNLDALDAFLAETDRQGIASDRLICIGDVVGYGPEPEACIARLRERAIATVLGNVEESIAADADDCGCNFIDGSTCDTLSANWYRYTRGHVSKASRDWMAALPRHITRHLGAHRLLAVHGGITRINRYIFASDDTARAEEWTMPDAPDAIIAGHCGIPFTRADGNRVWHNAGSLGLPANDGTPRVWYSRIALTRDGALRFEHCPLDYDHHRAAAKMRRAGLPEAYARTLETGLWPDTAILPAMETAQTGLPLAPAALTL